MKLLLALLVIHTIALGVPESAAPPAEHNRPQASPRLERRYGIYVGILGEPLPSLYSLNAAYNVSEDLRVHLGIGALPIHDYGGMSFGAGVKWFILQERRISPYLGLQVSAARARFDSFHGLLERVSGKGTQTQPSIGTVFVGAGSIGIDWQSETGLNLGLAFNVIGLPRIAAIPSGSFGWFF